MIAATDEFRPPRFRALKTGAWFALFTAYGMLATVSTIIFPAAAIVFLAPPVMLLIMAAPRGKPLPRGAIMSLLSLSVFLLAIWPVYLHVKLGPLPILTPPRVLLYLLTAAWMTDLLVSRIRRAQFALAFKRRPLLVGLTMAMFALGALSIPLAEGRAVAAPEFVRQLIIWLLPFCMVLTYCRKEKDFLQLVRMIAIGAVVCGAIAVAERASGTLLASLLSPFVADNAEWLRLSQAQKIRDGVFRAQAVHTHPLGLGEFLSMSAPLALALALRTRHRIARFWWLGGLMLIILGAMATSSRAVIVAMIAAMAVMSILLVIRVYARERVKPLRPFIGLVCLACIAAAPVAIASGAGLISGAGGQSAANSSQARIDQMALAWPKIQQRLILGYGTGRATRVLGYYGTALSIDNYYLSLALDYGLPGPIIFAGIIGTAIVAGLRRSRSSGGRMGLVFIAFVTSLVAFAVFRSVLSVTGNIGIFYMLIAAFIGSTLRSAPSAGIRFAEPIAPLHGAGPGTVR